MPFNEARFSDQEQVKNFNSFRKRMAHLLHSDKNGGKNKAKYEDRLKDLNSLFDDFKRGRWNERKNGRPEEWMRNFETNLFASFPELRKVEQEEKKRKSAEAEKQKRREASAREAREKARAAEEAEKERVKRETQAGSERAGNAGASPEEQAEADAAGERFRAGERAAAEEAESESEQAAADQGQEPPRAEAGGGNNGGGPGEPENEPENPPGENERGPERGPEDERADLERELNEARRGYAEYSDWASPKNKDAKVLNDLDKEFFPDPADLDRFSSSFEGQNDLRLKEGRFIDELVNRGVRLEDAQKFWTASVSKTHYDRARQKLADHIVSRKEEEFAAQGRLPLGERERRVAEMRMGILRDLVIKERAELFKQKAEKWPPKDKKLWEKSWDFYRRQNTFTRVAISTLVSTGVITGGVALVGGFGAATSALGMGSIAYRYARGLTSVALGKAAMGVTEKKMVNTEEDLSRKTGYLAQDFSLKDISAAANEYEKLEDEKARMDRKKALIKMAIGFAVGAGFAAGLRGVEHAFGGPVQVETHAPSGAAAPEHVPAGHVTPETHTEGGNAEVVHGTQPETAHAGPAQAETVHPAEAAQTPPAETAHAAPGHAPEVKPEAAGTEHAPEVKTETGGTVEAHVENQPELAEVRPGEGAWQAVHRQLEERLREDPSKFGLKAEDLADKIKVRHALDQATGKVLVKNHFIEAGGKEIRISRPGARVVLGPDDTLKVEGGGAKATYEYAPKGKEVPAGSKTAVLEKETLADEKVAPSGDEATPLESHPLNTGAFAAPDVPHTPPSHTGPFVEPVRTDFEHAFANQMEAHAGQPWADLNPGQRAAAEFFASKFAPGLRIHAEDTLATPGHVAGKFLDFEKFFANRELVGKTLDFAREAEALHKLGFLPNEYLNADYLNVVRNMPVKDFLKHFPNEYQLGTGGLAGKMETFAQGPNRVTVAMSEGYAHLADRMRFLSKMDKKAVKLTVQEFLKKHVEP